MSLKNMIVLLAGLAAVSVMAEGDRPGFSLTELDQSSNLFAGRETCLHFNIVSPNVPGASLRWNCTVSGSKVAAGKIRLAGLDDGAARIAVPITVPALKDGVVMPAMLNVSLHADESAPALAALEKKLWFFPEDPFADRRIWLENLKIHLFDPERKTVELLSRLDVKFDEIHNPDALPAIKDGVLVVGEGVSFMDYRGLPGLLFRVSAAGVTVLCLAPAPGMVPVPGMGTELPVPGRLIFQNAAIIKELDKRLDVHAWSGNIASVKSSFAVGGARGNAVAEWHANTDGWSWMEAQYNGRGRLIICGFGIVDQWEHGPTPRFLLLKLLEYISGINPQVQNPR